MSFFQNMLGLKPSSASESLDTTTDANNSNAAEGQQEIEVEFGQWFSVVPKTDCPHTDNAVSEVPEIFRADASSKPCLTCSDADENWVCLCCYKTLCSRYKNGHMLDHFNEDNSHCVGASFSDLSVWCFSCDAYIKTSITQEVLTLMHKSKFGEEPPVPGHTSYAHRTLAEIQETEESVEEMVAKAQEVAAILQQQKNVVVYTGAGVSTSAKLPDYRGPQGVWTLRDQGKAPTDTVTIEQALPTYCHMAIAELVKRKLVTFVVSTNVDGLHRRSGLSADELAELHGNCYKEICSECNAEYLRTFDVTSKPGACTLSHITGRKCDKCRGPLRDSIIHFGENLPESEILRSITAAEKADVALVLGTSMAVRPACTLPEMAKRLVIVNLQSTPYDEKAEPRVFARTDEFMRAVMDALHIEVGEYVAAAAVANGGGGQ